MAPTINLFVVLRLVSDPAVEISSCVFLIAVVRSAPVKDVLPISASNTLIAPVRTVEFAASTGPPAPKTRLPICVSCSLIASLTFDAAVFKV